MLRFLAFMTALACPALLFGADFQTWLSPQAYGLTISPDFALPDGVLGNLPKDWNGVCAAAARFAQDTAPAATAEQTRRWGLLLPANIDDKKPLVILIHGLDEDENSCASLRRLLTEGGWQTAVFCYPAERPIAQNAQLFADHYAALRQTFPNLHVDLVTQSMGALVARKYVEGDDYAGGIDRLIMIAPPNAGSKWAKFSIVQKLQTDWSNWRHDPHFSAAWMINEGICQSAHDLKPGSQFLRELNSHPRRAGVKYTIIAGDVPAGDRVASDLLQSPAQLLSRQLEKCPQAAAAALALSLWATDLRFHTGKSDGPVSLGSAELAGVADLVILHADHLSLYETIHGHPPAAWPVVKNRLESSHGG